MVRIIHGDVALRAATAGRVLVILAVTALEDVHFGIVDLRIHMVVQRTILGTKMFSTTGSQIRIAITMPISSITHKVGARLALNSQ